MWCPGRNVPEGKYQIVQTAEIGAVRLFFSLLELCRDFQVVTSLCSKHCKEICLLNLVLCGGTGLAARGRGELLRVSSPSCFSFPLSEEQKPLFSLSYCSVKHEKLCWSHFKVCVWTRLEVSISVTACRLFPRSGKVLGKHCAVLSISCSPVIQYMRATV